MSDEPLYPVSHVDGCDGLVLDGYEGVRTRAGEPWRRPVFAPCPTCEPGRRAVFRDGLWKNGWERDEQAIRAYISGELESKGTVARMYRAHGPDDRYIERMWKQLLTDAR